MSRTSIRSPGAPLRIARLVGIANLLVESGWHRTLPRPSRHPGRILRPLGAEYGCAASAPCEKRRMRRPRACGCLSSRPPTSAPIATALAPEQLRRTCDARGLGFATTAEVPPLDEVVGQPRAVEALDLALGTPAPGDHVFVTGPAGTGRRTVAEAHLRRHAAGRPAPPDRVYVFDFAAPRRPLAMTLPAGRGPAFAREVRQLVGE